MSPSRRRRAVQHLKRSMGLSERRACRLAGQPRTTQRYEGRRAAKDAALVKDIVELATKHPRFGYRRATAMLRRGGWRVNTKRVQRLRRQNGLQVRRTIKQKQHRGHSDNGCQRFKPEYSNHVWSLDFVSDQTEDGKRLKILAVIDEYTRRCLAIYAARSIRAVDVQGVLEELIWLHGKPGHIRSDNGPEFVANAIRNYLKTNAIETLYIAPGSPWENGYIESFNARFRDELLDREVFGNLAEARILLEAHRNFYNSERPHSSLSLLTPNEFHEAATIRSGAKHQGLS